MTHMATRLRSRGDGARPHRGGRPRRAVPRTQFAPILELDVIEQLRAQAATMAMDLTTYMALALSEVYGYKGPYLPPVEFLPTKATAAELRDRVELIAPEDCGVRNGPTCRTSVWVDEPLAEIIRSRADELDVAYAAYLRSVLRDIAGVPPKSQRGEQLALMPTPARRGEGAA